MLVGGQGWLWKVLVLILVERIGVGKSRVIVTMSVQRHCVVHSDGRIVATVKLCGEFVRAQGLGGAGVDMTVAASWTLCVIVAFKIDSRASFMLF